MDLRKLKTLIDLVSDSNVTELEITEAEGKVRIVKGPTGGYLAQAPMAAPQALVIPAGANASAPSSPVAAPAEPITEGQPIKSPMVGTFYRASSPGAKPFVEVGDTIKQGDTVCIVEAMKILNEIEADRSGVVTKILAQDGQAVEYGQTLILVE
jgi:acetyl-CoA carboxylase biotin carboxyl carrier protein